MRIDPWMLAGVVAPPLYAATVVLGGVLTPGYSHVAGPISALIMPGAPAVEALNPLFTVYNALLVAFAIGLRQAFAGKGAAISLLAPTLLALVGVAGILMLFYAMDPIGVPASESGRVHIYLSAIASLGSMAAIFFVARRLRHAPDWRRFAGYTYASLVVVLFSGGFAALAAASMSQVMGLWERITIGAFLQWVFVTALVLLRR